MNIIFVVTDKVLHYLKKFDYLFLTITIYLLSIGLFYIPMGIFQREYFFKTFNESAPCTSDTNLICTADIFWTCIRYSFLGPVGYMMFSFLFHKVSYKIREVYLFKLSVYRVEIWSPRMITHHPIMSFLGCSSMEVL